MPLKIKYRIHYMVTYYIYDVGDLLKSERLKSMEF